LRIGGVNPPFFQNMVSYTFTKGEKLCSQKIIGEIFLTSRTFICFPLKVVWLNNVILTGSYPAQVAFSVPKKSFNKAHDRNLIRRKMRESYRNLKSGLYELLEQDRQKIVLMIIFVGKEEPSFSLVESAMAKILYRLGKEIKSVKSNSGI
jgi:ribonuclease P protein component